MRFLTTLFITFSILHAGGGILDIQWPTPNPHQQKPTQPYPAVLTQGIATVKLPVYVPRNLAYDQNMSVVADNNFYNITFELGDASLMVSGDKTFQESVSPDNPEFGNIAKASPPVVFNRAEGMMLAEFNRHGVNYSMVIECNKPETDKRCKNVSFIQKMYSQLIFVGGNPS